MDHFLMLFLGLVFGVLIVYILKPALFIRQHHDFSAIEAMFDELMEEIEERQELFRQEVEQMKQDLMSLCSEMEKRVAEEGATAEYQEKDKREYYVNGSSSKRVKSVLELATHGDDALTIAKKLGLGKGEVQLILDLKNK